MCASLVGVEDSPSVSRIALGFGQHTRPGSLRRAHCAASILGASPAAGALTSLSALLGTCLPSCMHPAPAFLFCFSFGRAVAERTPVCISTLAVVRACVCVRARCVERRVWAASVAAGWCTIWVISTLARTVCSDLTGRVPQDCVFVWRLGRRWTRNAALLPACRCGRSVHSPSPYTRTHVVQPRHHMSAVLLTWVSQLLWGHWASPCRDVWHCGSRSGSCVHVTAR